MLGTFVSRIEWARGSEKNGDITAVGVEVATRDGEVCVIGARREVILAAGPLRSPAILELSGVGNPRPSLPHSND